MFFIPYLFTFPPKITYRIEVAILTFRPNKLPIYPR